MNAKHDGKRLANMLGWLVMVLCAAMPVRATTLLRVNFDTGAQNPAPSPYVAGAGDILPSGSTSVCFNPVRFSTENGKQGGQALAFTAGAASPVRQGYQFSALTNVQKFAQNSFTVEAIVRPDFSDAVYGGTNYGTTSRSIIFFGCPEGWGINSVLFVDQNTHKVQWIGAGGYGDMASIQTLAPNRWYHVAVVVDGSIPQVRMYIDGVIENAGAYPDGWQYQGIFSIGDTISVGNDPNTTTNNFAGLIDALSISDTALAETSFVLPSCSSNGTGVVFRTLFDFNAQTPAPSLYPYPSLPADILPQGCSGVRLDTNNAIVRGDGYQGRGALVMMGGGAAPNTQGYKFWDVAANKLVQNSFTLEVICKPCFSDAVVDNVNYGRTAKSTLLANEFRDMCWLYLDQQTGLVHFRGYTGYGDIDSSMVLTNGQWYHTAVVVDGAALQTRLYINGVQDGYTGNYPYGWHTQGIYQVYQHLFIGTTGLATGENFCGEIDAVAISDTARSVEDFVLPVKSTRGVLITIH
ncbi:MAG: LamG domain-containing protein [Kiritimatiellae bacterium]|nr:LamG domain-containing protein [Kiritimatiellia bacterium]